MYTSNKKNCSKSIDPVFAVLTIRLYKISMLGLGTIQSDSQQAVWQFSDDISEVANRARGSLVKEVDMTVGGLSTESSPASRR